MKAICFMALTCFVFVFSPLTSTGQRRNVRPVIISQVPLSVQAGEPLTIQLSHLIVLDLDDFYPFGFSLKVKNGKNYSRDGNTITPDIKFTGTLKVSVTVHDGEDESREFDLQITVTEPPPGSQNVAPVITGQVPLQTLENAAIQITLSMLTVEDPDNLYPGDFTFRLFNGNNYTIVGGDQVRPAPGFLGTLTVEIVVNDGYDDSPRFPLSIRVVPENVAPEITGQQALTTEEGTPITITLANLKVEDPDNKYPDDFTLLLSPGSNYQLNGATVTPTAGFAGTLQVNTRVNDGKSNSNLFLLKIKVEDRNDPPVITGQTPLTTREDTPLTLRFQDIIVFDPDNTYPNGFTMQILSGKNYTVNNLTITPAGNFHGPLAVPVTVNDGELTSQPFTLTVNVTAVNDAPQIINLESTAIEYVAGRGQIAVSENVEVRDVDDDNIALAEITFDAESYRPGQDVLIFNRNESITIDGVFDPARGTMIFIGNAPASEYQKAFRSISYDFIDDEDANTPLNDSVKVLYFSVSDGQLKSEVRSRKIKVISTLSLDIPNAFTPNGDLSNDTWKITPVQTFDDYSEAVIRVYNIRGQLLYEANGFESSWDGTHNGESLPSDTYYFTIDLKLSFRAAQFKGIVTLLR